MTLCPEKEQDNHMSAKIRVIKAPVLPMLLEDVLWGSLIAMDLTATRAR